MEDKINIGNCSICGRVMFDGASINEHHLVPKSLKGKDKITLHTICHQKIHTLFTERELLHKYNTVQHIIEHSEMQKFIKWILKKDPEYYERNKTSNELIVKRKAKKFKNY